MEQQKGAFFTGEYRNIFKENGYSDEQINKRINYTWNKLFYGDEDTRIYYPVGDDIGYIMDTGNLDVRTEGMSYGMMMSVQMNRKEEFNRLWKWTKKYMWQKKGKYEGYFAWSANMDGTKRAEGPAPDGEEYFAMALFFASHRWGDGEEPFNYSEQAQNILHECVHKGENGQGQSMWEGSNKLIKFIPEVDFSDPSYHLPHFYELFSLYANEEDKEFWKSAAEESRKYLRKSCYPVTGLAPEYANYDGSPKFFNGHGDFYSDSYRVAGNIGLDYEWFGKDEWEREEADRIQDFFLKREEDASNGYYKYSIDGVPLGEKALHPVGLLAMNAMAALATTKPVSKKFVDKLWETPLRTGKRRYYDNCLYFFSLLALSGNYRMW